jgi:hypothetical protein
VRLSEVRCRSGKSEFRTQLETAKIEFYHVRDCIIGIGIDRFSFQ